MRPLQCFFFFHFALVCSLFPPTGARKPLVTTCIMVLFKARDCVRYTEDEGATWLTAVVVDVNSAHRTLTLRMSQEGRVVSDVSWDSDALSLIHPDKLIVEPDFRSPTHLWFFVSGIVATVSWSFFLISPLRPKGAIISGTAGLFGLAASWFVRSFW